MYNWGIDYGRVWEITPENICDSNMCKSNWCKNMENFALLLIEITVEDYNSKDWNMFSKKKQQLF